MKLMHEKNEKKLRLKQYRLIQRNVKYFQDVSMARRMPLGFRDDNGVVTIESDEVAYLELLKDAYKLTNEYESVSFFSRGGILLWYAVLVLKCYTLSSLPYFLYLNFGLILFHFIIAPRVQIFGGMTIDSLYHLHVARLFAGYLDNGTFQSLTSYSERFFLLAVLTVSSGAFSIFFCQVLMRTIFASIWSPPPKMKLYYDIIILFSFLHFLYGAYISYGIFNGTIDTISHFFW